MDNGVVDGLDPGQDVYKAVFRGRLSKTRLDHIGMNDENPSATLCPCSIQRVYDSDLLKLYSSESKTDE